MAHKNTVEPRFTVGEVIKFIEPGFNEEIEIVAEITAVTTFSGKLAYEVDYPRSPAVCVSGIVLMNATRVPGGRCFVLGGVAFFLRILLPIR